MIAYIACLIIVVLLIIVIWYCNVGVSIKIVVVSVIIAIIIFMQSNRATMTYGGGHISTTSKLKKCDKWSINIISKNEDLINATDKIKSIYNIIYYDEYPEFNKPAFITITDQLPKYEIPSTYILQYVDVVEPDKNNSRIIQFSSLDDISNLCKGLANGDREVLPSTISMYNVGEHIFTKTSPSTKTLNYDDSYDIWVDDRDTLIRESAVSGIPYEKYMTACLSSFIEPGATILDVGTNVGTVSLPLSRLHDSSVKIVSFEPFEDTYSILFKNVVQNDARNITPLKMAAGDKNRKKISMSNNVVVLPHYTDKISKPKIVNIRGTDKNIHFGSMHVGIGDEKSRMTTIDELRLNISAMKVDIEGAEPLAFYGARETIKRCMPVIVFERNENTISPEMIKSLHPVNEEAVHFNILEYCLSLGYADLYELDIQDYMLVPPGRKQLEKKSIAKFKSVNMIKGFEKQHTTGYKLYKFDRPQYNKPKSKIIHKKILLADYEDKIYSQNGEDGMISKIFELIEPTNKFYVEFGVEDGSECNTKNLRKNGWHGLMMDGSNKNVKINLQKEFITKDNVRDLFRKYKVPKTLDFLSTDIDYNDLYVLKAILESYSPSVICAEYNSYVDLKDAVVVYDPNNMWDKTKYFGASITAFNTLLKIHGYVIIGSNGVNIFAVKRKYGSMFKNAGNLRALHKKINGYHHNDYHNRKFMPYEKAILYSADTKSISNNIRVKAKSIPYLKSYIESKRLKKWDKELESKLFNDINKCLQPHPTNRTLIYNYISSL